MTVELSRRDRRMLEGGDGGAARLAMAVLVRMAEVVEAAEMMDVTQAHIDGCGLLSDAGLEFAERLAGLGGQVSIPTTLNMGPLDLQNWRQWGVPQDFAEKAIRQGKAYTDMGCVPTWTCAPYQGYLTPRFAQQIAWGESNAVVYANSVLGARTNRYGDYIDICAAITGRVPRCGLHITENRRGQVLLRLTDVDAELLREDAFYPVLGHFMGPVAGDRIPVIEGLPADVSGDQLKALGAAVASSGGVEMFHAIGVTPEAATAADAFQGGEAEEVIEVRPADLAAARADLSTADEGAKLDVVVVGCPHYSYAEFRKLTRLIEATGGKTVCEGVRFIVITGQASLSLVRRSEMLAVLDAFGAEITLDTCPFHTPMVDPAAEVMMTDSGKCAYYAPGELDIRIAFGGIGDCVRSAVEGRVRREDGLWKGV